MLVLLFEMDGGRYAVDAVDVVEVLPIVSIRPLPQPATGIAGTIVLRGVSVPVVDLPALIAGRPARSRLSTRIAVVRDGTGAHARVCALLVERATETRRRARTDFKPAPVRHDRAPFLGAVSTEAEGVIQLIDVRRLMSVALPAAADETEAGSHAVV